MPAKLQGISIQADSVIMFAALFAVFAGSNDCPLMIVGNSIKRDYKQTPLGFSKKLLAFDFFLCNKTYGDSGNNRQDDGYSANFRLARPGLLFFVE